MKSSTETQHCNRCGCDIPAGWPDHLIDADCIASLTGVVKVQKDLLNESRSGQHMAEMRLSDANKARERLAAELEKTRAELKETVTHLFNRNAEVQSLTAALTKTRAELAQARADILAVSKQVWESGANPAAGGDR